MAQLIWTGGVTHLTIDSIPYSFDENWLYHSGDNSKWALPGYNDSNWKKVDPRLRRSDDPDLDFNGIAWLRLHVNVDSTLAGKVMALTVKQAGASEIFIDGERIIKYGKISAPDSTEYYDPRSVPLPVTFSTTGEHVIAVRYACFYAKAASENYDKLSVGLSMGIGMANYFIDSYVSRISMLGLVFLLLSGLFFTLAAVHFLLWIYQRADRSNLYFSIFCCSLFVAFLLPYLNMVIHDPGFGRWTAYGGVIVTVAVCISLSGLSNVLFSRKKLRFYIIASICLLALPLVYFNFIAAVLFLVFVGVLVTFESIWLTIAAIYRKQKGARIVGVGVLFFTMFIFLLLLGGIFNSGIEINDGTPQGRVLMILLAAAILSIPVSMSIYLASSFATMNRNLNMQLDEVKRLSAKTLAQEQEKQHMLETRKEELEKEVAARTEELERQHEELKAEKNKSDALLRNILPEEIAEELKNKGASEARYFDHVTVIFTDFVDFTKAGERMTPQELVDELHTCFKAFDGIISRYNIEKIKTIGDAYLAVCGLPASNSNHAVNTVKAALEIRQFMNERKKQMPDKTFDIRIGIHSGAVVAGIVGVKKFAYDIWGDTVNTAARMESSSEPDKINISETTYQLVNEHFNCVFRGEIEAKNKGEMKMYFVDSIKV